MRRLIQLDFSSAEVPQELFPERFGQMADLNGSIRLAVFLEDLPTLSFEPENVACHSLVEAFFSVRGELMGRLIKRFAATKDVQGIKLPSAEELYSHCLMSGVWAAKKHSSQPASKPVYEPYRRFYTACQDDLASRIHPLRERVREEISGLSLEYAQLAKLDQTVTRVIANKIRERFAVIPTLMGKRFERFFNAHWDELPEKPSAKDLSPWLTPHGWLHGFCAEMRELLLAEIDVRLGPVLGMLEALPAQSVVHPSLG